MVRNILVHFMPLPYWYDEIHSLYSDTIQEFWVKLKLLWEQENIILNLNFLNSSLSRSRPFSTLNFKDV